MSILPAPQCAGGYYGRFLSIYIELKLIGSSDSEPYRMYNNEAVQNIRWKLNERLEFNVAKRELQQNQKNCPHPMRRGCVYFKGETFESSPLLGNTANTRPL